MSPDLIALALEVGAFLKARDWTLTTAESCTGGLIAASITEIAGASEWFERGFVTYANASKCQDLGVTKATLDAHGAVSEETVREMVAGALARSQADVAVAISGIAGPGGGTPQKPVGTIWLAWGLRGGDVIANRSRFEGDRTTIRHQAAQMALLGVLDVR